jgi:hypothetical protein
MHRLVMPVQHEVALIQNDPRFWVEYRWDEDLPVQIVGFQDDRISDLAENEGRIKDESEDSPMTGEEEEEEEGMLFSS